MHVKRSARQDLTGLIRADPDVASCRAMDLAERLRILSDLEPVLTAPEPTSGTGR